MKKGLRILSLLMVLALVCSFFSGCKDNEKGSNVGTGNSGDIKFLADPADYKGTTVVYATWKDPEKNEDGPVIKAFEEKYGINVEIMLLNQTTYVNSIASSIASGSQPDIFFENARFPGSLTVMQPLDNAMINFEDPIWDQNIIKASTIEGHPYLVDTLSNVWAETDICVYNKKIFADNNINSPKDYYDQGKWTFAAFKQCAKDVASLGKDYVGATVVGDVALAAAGSSIISYNNGKIQHNLDDHLYDVMTFLAQMKADGYIKYSRESFTDGKTGIAFTNCFGLKKTGYFTTINPDHLGAVPLPKWDDNSQNYSSAIYRGWGLVKGAKNPVAAGIFLREYLDVNNYDLENTFHSGEAANFFFQITGQKKENTIYYLCDAVALATGKGESYGNAWDKNSPAQIKTYLDGQKNVINAMCNQANDIISTEKKWLKDNY